MIQMLKTTWLRCGLRLQDEKLADTARTGSLADLAAQILAVFRNDSTYKNTGDQSLPCGIYMPTTILQKTSAGALRTFKRFGASCYSGVPVFPIETRPLTV